MLDCGYFILVLLFYIYFLIFCSNVPMIFPLLRLKMLSLYGRTVFPNFDFEKSLIIFGNGILKIIQSFADLLFCSTSISESPSFLFKNSFYSLVILRSEVIRSSHGETACSPTFDCKQSLEISFVMECICNIILGFAALLFCPTSSSGSPSVLFSSCRSWLWPDLLFPTFWCCQRSWICNSNNWD